MPISWATSAGVDVHLDLRGSRVRASLESALRDAIAGGRLRPGARLPSSRSLAADLGIARNTVADAYGQLVAEGWLTARQGSGTRVAQRAASPADPVVSQVARAPERAFRYDLRPGTPDLSAFPRSAWLSAARAALLSAPYDALAYSDPLGRPELRSALAEYLSRARGVRASAERIVVCSGFTQALWLLCQLLRSRGALELAIEEYVLGTTREAAIACGLGVTTIPIDEHGADVGVLRSAAAALLTPAHQFPIGVPLSAARRAQAVAWARASGGLLIEDDYDGEFRYDRHPLGAVQALDPERVVYAGTASKTLAPGIRLAWLVLPAELVDDAVRAKLLLDHGSSAIDQLTLAELIRSGTYDRHVRRARLAYRRRRDRLLSAIPHVAVTGIAAGLHALVELPPTVSERAVIALAADHGLALEGLESYATPRAKRRPALVVGYATPPEHAYTGALARLAAALSAATG